MLYVLLDVEGYACACYNDRFVTDIPPKAVPVTEEAWDALASGNFRWVTGELVPREAPATAMEDPWTLLREERNRRLGASDWTQLADVPLSEVAQTAWRMYRQALRDMPENCDPLSPVWPVAPKKTRKAAGISSPTT